MRNTAFQSSNLPAFAVNEICRHEQDAGDPRQAPAELKW